MRVCVGVCMCVCVCVCVRVCFVCVCVCVEKDAEEAYHLLRSPHRQGKAKNSTIQLKLNLVYSHSARADCQSSDGSLTLKRRNVLHTLHYTNHKTTASKVALVRKNHVTYYVRNSNCFFLRMTQLRGAQRHARTS